MGRVHPILLALIFAFFSVAVFFTAFTLDPFSIFSIGYAWIAVFIPGLLFPASIFFTQFRHRTFGWLMAITGVVACMVVAFIHIAVVAAASASV